jgi:hypothetical protein
MKHDHGDWYFPQPMRCMATEQQAAGSLWWGAGQWHPNGSHINYKSCYYQFVIAVLMIVRVSSFARPNRWRNCPQNLGPLLQVS